MKKLETRRNVHIFLYGAAAVFYLWMAAQIPYTHDDWDWGIPMGLQYLLTANINSRYVGNFCVVVMTRSELLKTLMMGSVCFLIPYSLARFAEKELSAITPTSRMILFAVCNCFFLSMDTVLWRQTYGWVSGFANFAISSVFLLLWIYEIQRAVAEDFAWEKDSGFKIAAYFLVSLCGQLFLENVAIYCVLTAIALCAAHYIRNRKLSGRILAMTAGAVVGLVIMFSSSLYDTLLQEGQAIGTYRKIPILGDEGLAKIVWDTVSSLMHLGGRLYSLNVIRSVAVLVMLVMHRVNRREKIRYGKSFLAVDIALIAAFALCYIYDECCYIHSRVMTGCDFFVAVVFCLSTAAQVILLFVGETRRKLLAAWLSAVLIIAPLVVTTERGQRLFFSSNVFLALFALILLANIMNTCTGKKLRILKRCAVGCMAAMLCFYGIVYAGIGESKRTRDQIIAGAVREGTDTIVLPAYPYEQYLHASNPEKELYRVEYFKEFYGIAENVTLIFE